MSRDAQRVGSEPVRAPGPGRHARPTSGPAQLATMVGNRAMQRIAAGETPAGLTTRTLQRDTPKGDTPKYDTSDPKSGWWVKFQGSKTPLGDWLPLGNFSLDKGTDADEVTGFVDILLASPKGLNLGTAFDTSEQVTLLIEQRHHDAKPIRQPAQKVVITAVDIKTTFKIEHEGTARRATDPQTHIHVGLRVLGATDGR